MTSRYLSMDELNKTALEHFVYQPVNREMIAYLADAAHNVIACDSSLMPPEPAPSSQKSGTGNAMPTPPRSPEPQAVKTDDASLPTLEEFITQLVVSSNVQVPTLMSTLVYLNRLRSKLQPMARGLRCTTHRIFLACLILAAKYLNDSSPKNKHWASYSHINTDLYSFGFNRTEVNLMEKQLLFLLEWDLRITEQDLYQELDSFLEPLRFRIAERHAKKMRQREEKKVYKEMLAQASRYSTSPPSSRGHSRTRYPSPEHLRAPSSESTPPGLTYSSSASSYTPSISSSTRQASRATTPLDRAAEQPRPEPYMYETSQHGSLYDSPVEIMMEPEVAKDRARMLPYEISPEQYQQLHEEAPKKRQKRGMWERILGASGAVSVR